MATFNPIRLPINFDFLFRSELKSLQNGNDINISGATRMYLIPSASITGIVTNAATNVVTSITTTQQWSVFNNIKDLQFKTKVMQSRNGVLYSTGISFVLPRMSTIKTKVILGLTGNEYTCIVQDNNETFWLIGADKSFTTDDAGIEFGTESNGYAIKMSANELQPLLEVAPTFIQTLQLSPYADSTEAVRNASLSYLSVTLDPTPGTLGGNSVVYPADGYTVTNDVAFVLATSGFTVKLPATPQNNQLLTIKDAGNGSTEPVIIRGNGKDIEGYSYAEINTDAGAIELIFINGGWRVKSFWNI